MEVFLCWTYRDKPGHALRASEAEAATYQKQLASMPTNPDGSRFEDFTIEPLTPCLEHFTRLVHAHDLTYMMSDDHRCWERGTASFNRIAMIAKALPGEEVAHIWNAWVDTQLVKDEAPRWYWRKDAP